VILESIVIQDFRKLSDRLVIEGLEPGLNLICGPNEAGKSTIAEAVRTVFLERYKVTGLGALVPNARPDATPTVEVGFDIGGVKHRLVKQFVKRQRCNLRIGTKTFDADEAEEELAKLIGFSRTERGTSRPENAGIPGLLWVRQGQTGEVRDPGEHASSYVREALAKLIGGEMPGGDDALIDAVQQDLFKLVTERARKPTGEFAAVESDIAQRREEQSTLEQQIRDFEDETTRLGRLQAEYESAQKARPWEAMREKAAAATARAQSFDALQRAHDELAQKLKVTTVEHGALLEKEQQAAALETSVKEDRKALEHAKTIAEQADAAHMRAQGTVEHAQKASDDAQGLLAKANAAERGAELKAQLEAQRAEISRIETTLAKAVESSDKVQALTREAALAEIDEKKLKRLDQIGTRIVPLQARRDAALTRIEYRLTGAIMIDGAPVQGDGVVRLDGEKIIGLPGLGELTIVPGVSDLSGLLTELQDLEAEQGKLILELGISGYAEGVERQARWRSLCTDRDGHVRMLEAHAPNGLERLRSDLEEARGRLGATTERLDALEDVTGALPVADARDAADTARMQLEAARAALLESSGAKAQASARARDLAERLDANQARLDDPVFIAERQQRQAALVEKSAHIDEYTRNLLVSQQQIEDANRDDPRAEAERYNRSATIAHDEQLERQRNIGALRARLETLGGTGIGERLAQTVASIEQAEVRHTELRLRAQALALLESVLVEERDIAVATLRKPLTDRVDHYLKRVFPTGALEVDEGLAPTGLVRGSRVETLDSLSYGTQEQLGLLARLAYADLLQAAGKPTLLLFDDAVVHSDDERRDGIKRALLDAATRHQILVFTCHPSAWSDLGVKQRHLDDLKAASRESSAA
jgi:hypothetical protein